MKTPKELNKIYDRLPKDKTALSTQKIELALVDDLGQALTKGQITRKNIIDEDDKAKVMEKEIAAIKKSAAKVQTNALKLVGVADKFYDSASKLLEKSDKAAKDLGVNPFDITGYKALNTIIGDIESDAGKLEDRANDIVQSL